MPEDADGEDLRERLTRASDDPERVDLYRELESRCAHQNAYEEAMAAAQAAARILERLVAVDRLRYEPRLAHTLHRIAGLNARLGRHQDALAAADRALVIYDGYTRADAAGLDEARASLELICGDALTTLERPAEAARALERAETLYERLTAQGATALRPALASARQRHGVVLAALGRYEEAHATLTQALELYETLAAGASIHSNSVIECLLVLAQASCALGRFEEALAALPKAVDLLERQPAAGPMLAFSVERLAAVLHALGRHDAAATTMQRAATLYENSAEKNPGLFEAELAATLMKLAQIHVAADRLESVGQAARAASRAVTLYRTLIERDRVEFRPELAHGSRVLGELLQNLGLVPQARAAFDDAVAGYEALAVDDASFCEELAASLSDLGVMLARRSPKDALHPLTRAIALYDGDLASDADFAEPRLARCQTALGAALSLLGRFEDAARANERAVTLYEALAAHDPGQFDERLADGLCALASTWRELARWTEAVATSIRAVTLYERLAAASTSSAFEVKLAVELQHLEETRVRAGLAPPPVPARATAGQSRWLIGKVGPALTTPASPTSGSRAPTVRGRDERTVMWGTDRRLGCITGRNLSLLVGDLREAGFAPMDVHTLARRFRERQLYPARDFAHRCTPRRPTLFVSYDWGMDFIDLQEAVHSGLQLVAAIVREHRPALDEDRVQRLCLDQIGIWIDHVFIDQSSREITEEVRFVVPNVIEAADIHFVLSPTALMRAWCCYELALFTHTRPPEMQSGVLRSFVAPTILRYRGWSAAKTTSPGDKPVLQQALEEQFPGGIDGVDALLIQSSLQSDRSVLSSPAYSGEAEQLVTASIDRWLEV